MGCHATRQQTSVEDAGKWHRRQYGQHQEDLLAGPAGSIFITAYNIWHRRSVSTGTGLRNLLKYNYWRTAPPQRDWISEPDFDIATADFSAGGFESLERPTFRQ